MVRRVISGEELKRILRNQNIERERIVDFHEKKFNHQGTMSKISLEEVEAKLREKNVDAQIVKTVIKELEEVVEEEKDNRDTTPKQKNEFLIVLLDPNDELKGRDFTGFVVQQKQGDDAGLVLDKIRTAAHDTNAAKKRKKNMIKTMTDAFHGIKRAFIKSKNIMIKTKIPVRVLITNDKLSEETNENQVSN